jgi:hypothetical protein
MTALGPGWLFSFNLQLATCNLQPSFFTSIQAFWPHDSAELFRMMNVETSAE